MENEDKLKELNDKKVEAFNLIRLMGEVNQRAKLLNDQYIKLDLDIKKLEKDYIDESKKE